MKKKFKHPSERFPERIFKWCGFVEDKRLGFKMPPNTTVCHTFHPIDGSILVMDGQLGEAPPSGEDLVDYELQTDADGFGNESVPQSADIIVLGNSVSVSANVKREESWPSILKTLAGKSLYNAAHNAYCVTQGLLVLNDYGMPKHPKIVLWEVFSDELDLAERFYDFQTNGNSYYGSLQAPQPPVPHEETLASFVASLIKKWRDRKNRYPVYPGPMRLSIGGVEKPVLLNRWAFPTHARSREETERTLGWRLISEAFLKGKEMCDKAGTRLIVVHVPDPVPLLAPYTIDKYDRKKIFEYVKPALKALGMRYETPDKFIEDLRKNLNVMARLFEDFCRAHNIEFVNTQPALAASLANGQRPFYCYDVHLNVVGNRVVAEVLAEYLKSHP